MIRFGMRSSPSTPACARTPVSACDRHGLAVVGIALLEPATAGCGEEGAGGLAYHREIGSHGDTLRPRP